MRQKGYNLNLIVGTSTWIKVLCIDKLMRITYGSGMPASLVQRTLLMKEVNFLLSWNSQRTIHFKPLTSSSWHLYIIPILVLTNSKGTWAKEWGHLRNNGNPPLMLPICWWLYNAFWEFQTLWIQLSQTLRGNIKKTRKNS